MPKPPTVDPKTPHEEMRELDKAGISYVVTIAFGDAHPINRAPVVAHSPNWICVEVADASTLDRWWIATSNIRGVQIEQL